MNRYRSFFMAFGMASVLALAGCGQAPVEAALEAPALVEPVDGSELSRITLTERAVERLGIQTAAVEEVAVDGVSRTAMPYSAILYDAGGATWAYISPEPRVFVRSSIVVDHIEGDLAVLVEGPEPATLVVTVGGAELYGTETGVGGAAH